MDLLAKELGAQIGRCIDEDVRLTLNDYAASRALKARFCLSLLTRSATAIEGWYATTCSGSQKDELPAHRLLPAGRTLTTGTLFFFLLLLRLCFGPWRCLRRRDFWWCGRPRGGLLRSSSIRVKRRTTFDTALSAEYSSNCVDGAALWTPLLLYCQKRLLKFRISKTHKTSSPFQAGIDTQTPCP